MFHLPRTKTLWLGLIWLSTFEVGSAYEFLRNRDLNARNFFAPPGPNKPEFTRNQYGTSAGAPILKDKLFFFLNFEGDRERQNTIANLQVYSAAHKAGNFPSTPGASM